ncbi:MAG: proline dehydrogenase family protein [Nocardioides sp.]|uniref:proline dehydrogenase family protein n=1 Tax=Nocardioides sp. TaxID=35761 RepID=UPI003F0F63DC
MPLLRPVILFLARNDGVRRAVSALPLTSRAVAGYVPGEGVSDVLDVAAGLLDEDMLVSVDFLGEDVEDPDLARASVQTYKEALAQLGARGWGRRVEVSLKLTSIGLSLEGDGAAVVLEHAREICRAARNAGSTVTLDMESSATTDATLAVLRELRKDFPETGVCLQAALRRTESDCRLLSYEGSRVRLCKGAFLEAPDVAHVVGAEVDKAFVRCLKILMGGQGYPMVATHDPRMVRIAQALASRYGRRPGTYEFQLLYGVRAAEQRRLVGSGESVRVYVPYGREWYGYVMRRLAERPRNVRLVLRSLVSRR